MFKNIFHPNLDWIEKVLLNGRLATATLLVDPLDLVKNPEKKHEDDEWLDIPVELKAYKGEQCITTMKCHLMQVKNNMLIKGMQVSVKFDPLDRRRVILVEQVEEKV